MQEAQQLRTGQTPIFLHSEQGLISRTPNIDSHCTSFLRAQRWVYVNEAGDEYPDQTFLNLSPTAIPELNAPPPNWTIPPSPALTAADTSTPQTTLPRWLTRTEAFAPSDFPSHLPDDFPPRLPDDPSFLTIARPRALLFGFTTHFCSMHGCILASHPHYYTCFSHLDSISERIALACSSAETGLGLPVLPYDPANYPSPWLMQSKLEENSVVVESITGNSQEEVDNRVLGRCETVADAQRADARAKRACMWLEGELIFVRTREDDAVMADGNDGDDDNDDDDHDGDNNNHDGDNNNEGDSRESQDQDDAEQPEENPTEEEQEQQSSKQLISADAPAPPGTFSHTDSIKPLPKNSILSTIQIQIHRTESQETSLLYTPPSPTRLRTPSSPISSSHDRHPPSPDLKDFLSLTWPMDEHGNILWADDDDKDVVGTSKSESDNSYDWGGNGSDTFSEWWDTLYGNDPYVPTPASGDDDTSDWFAMLYGSGSYVPSPSSDFSGTDSGYDS